MLTRIKNELGAVTIDENLINDTISDVILSFHGNVRTYKNAGKGQCRMTDDGVFIHLELVIKIGTSISEAASSMIEALSFLIKEQLELEVANIEVKIAGMQSFGKVLPRDILYDYKSGLVKWNEQ